MDKDPIGTQISKLSDYLYDDTTIVMSMSKLYHDFAVENYNLYKQHRLELHNFISKLMDHITLIFSSSITASNSESLLDRLTPYKDVIDKDMNQYEAILTHPKESIKLVIDLFDFVSNTEGFKEIEKLKYANINETFTNSFKYGIAAIAFEAFSLEALINENLLQYDSKNQLDKLQKMNSYLSKLQRLLEIVNVEEDFSDILNSIDKLMKARNEIAHFKGLKYSFSNLVNIFIHNDEHQDELFYYGEALRILDDDFFVHDKLNALIKKNKI